MPGEKKKGKSGESAALSQRGSPLMVKFYAVFFL
jgi:hypothetical protein